MTENTFPMKRSPGRPTGKPDRRQIYTAIKDDIPAILKKLTEQALAGDAQSARILLERSIPVVKASDIHREIPITGSTAVERAQSVLDAVSSGELSLSEATTVMQLIGAAAQIEINTELLSRVELLEHRLAANEGSVYDPA